MWPYGVLAGAGVVVLGVIVIYQIRKRHMLLKRDERFFGHCPKCHVVLREMESSHGWARTVQHGARAGARRSKSWSKARCPKCGYEKTKVWE